MKLVCEAAGRMLKHAPPPPVSAATHTQADHLRHLDGSREEEVLSIHFTPVKPFSVNGAAPGELFLLLRRASALLTE